MLTTHVERQKHSDDENVHSMVTQWSLCVTFKRVVDRRSVKTMMMSFINRLGFQITVDDFKPRNALNVHLLIAISNGHKKFAIVPTKYQIPLRLLTYSKDDI